MRIDAFTPLPPAYASPTAQRPRAAGVGRRSVPPLVVAVVLVLQRLEGLADREAVGRFTFGARWKYACGGLPFDAPGFAHTELVGLLAERRDAGGALVFATHDDELVTTLADRTIALRGGTAA